MRNHQRKIFEGKDRLKPSAIRRSAIAALLSAALFFALPASAAERIPDDTYFNQQWYLHKIGVTQAWTQTIGFEGITVAVIDSGVDIDHPDLKSNIWRNKDEIAGDGVDNDLNGYVDDVQGWDFISNTADPRPKTDSGYTLTGASHGTVAAGLIAAAGNNGQGIAGVTWQTTIMPLRALDSNGVGDPLNVVRAVEYAVRNGARVINLGFVGNANSDLLRIALRRAYESGVVVVAAAGNAPDGGEALNLNDHPLYPVCLDQGSPEKFIIGVGAADEFDRKADFSNYGSSCVELSAPGVHVISTTLYRPGTADFGKPYAGYFTGTSVSAPIVAGVAALLLSINPKLTPAEVYEILRTSAAPGDKTDPQAVGKYGAGRVDAAAAVTLLLSRMQTANQAADVSKLTPSPAGRLYATAPGAGRPAEIRLFTGDGLFVRSFLALPASFTGGAQVASGRFDGGKADSIVVGAGPGGLPQIRIFNRDTQEIGNFLAFNAGFRGGVSVATGDVNGDGHDEIVVGAGPGGGPHVRVFAANGDPIGGGFFAFDKGFRGGVSVTAGDVNGDGLAEIIVVSGKGMVASVRIFDVHGELLSGFQPLGTAYKQGATVALADWNGDGRPEIEIIPPSKTAKSAALFDWRGDKLGEFDYRKPSWKVEAGVRKDETEVILGAAGGQTPSVTVLKPGRVSFQFLAYDRRFLGGVSVATIK